MKRILVLCTGNSCRSQMAEGLFRSLGNGQWEAYSAGSAPSGYVHPLAIQAMADRGIDISEGKSKSVSDFKDEDFDLVVTVCDHANDNCPYFPSSGRREHWPFDDPADAEGTEEEKYKVFCRVRDEIEKTIREYLSMTD